MYTKQRQTCTNISVYKLDICTSIQQTFFNNFLIYLKLLTSHMLQRKTLIVQCQTILGKWWNLKTYWSWKPSNSSPCSSKLVSRSK